MKSNIDNSLVIRARSIVFIILNISAVSMLGLTLTLFILCFTDKNDKVIYLNIWALLVSLVGAAICIYFFYQLIRNGKVVFIDNEFITLGHNKNIYPPIHKNCNDFLSYKQNAMFANIQFTFNNGKQSYFFTLHYTRKQIIQILNEIKKRGGLQNQDIIIK